jgi:tetratricopeptide (TPR) repeat protein
MNERRPFDGGGTADLTRRTAPPPTALQKGIDMDAATLGTMRRLGIFTPIWKAHRNGLLDLADPETRFQFLRVCRDTERFDEALPLLEPFPETSPKLLSEQLVAADKIGDRPRLESALQTALRLTEDRLNGPLPDPILACAVAHAHASLGRLREGLRAVQPFRKDLTTSGPAFNTHMFLLVRLGWYRAAYLLIQETDDVHRIPEDVDAAAFQLVRLVSAARSLTRAGDIDTALRCHERARELSGALYKWTGVSYPWAWRWHAFTLRAASLWGRFDELLDEAQDAPLWRSEHNPNPGATVADSAPLRIERALRALSQYDGFDTDPMREALKDIDDVIHVHGDSGDIAQARAALLHQLGDESALLEQAESHPYSVACRIEHTRLLAEHGMLAQARAAAERLHERQPTRPEALQLRVALDARALPPDPDGPIASARELREAFREDAQLLAISAEKLAESGHFTESEEIFQHLTSDNPVFGLGWAGRIRAAAWRHDWGLVDRIEAEYGDRAICPDDADLSGSDRFSPYWFAIGKALTYATLTDFDAACNALAEAEPDWRVRIPAAYKSASTDPLWAWNVEQLLWRHRIREAEDECLSALARAPENPYYLVKYGWVLAERHDFEAAETQFRRALEIRPESSGAWKGLIRSLRFRLRIAEAHRHAEAARRVLSHDPDIWCEHAALNLAVHDLEGARTVLEEALRFAPNHANALAMYVHCLSKQRDHQRALTAAELACRRRPESIEVWEAHCMALLRRGWDKQALKVMLRARETVRAACSPGGEKRDLNIELLSAGVFAQCGAELSHCMEVVEALERHPGSATATATAASLLRHGLRLEAAREAVESFPGWEHEFELLREHAEIAAMWGPGWTSSDAEFAAAELLDGRGGDSQCAYDLARARQVHPYSIMTIRRQVHLWNARRRFDDSMMLLGKAATLFPEHFVIEMLTAETDLMRGSPEAARQRCEAVMEQFEDQQHQPIWLRILHLRSVRATGQIEWALGLAEALQRQYPASRRARLALARSLEDFDRTSQGLDHLQRYLRELPSFPPVGETAALFCRLRGEFERGEELIMDSLRYLDYSQSQEEVFPRADSGLLAELVLILASRKRFKEAARYSRVLLDREDVHSQSLGHISAGWLAVYESRFEDAETHFEQTLQTGLCSNEARFGLGQTRMLRADRTSDPEQRRRLLRAARSLAQQNIDDSDFERSLILAGQSMYQLDNWEEAEQCFRKSIEVHPVHGGHLELAVVLNHQGRLTEALAVAELGAKWKSADPKLLATLGLTRIRMFVEQGGDTKLKERGAIEIDRALTTAPTDPTVISAVAYAANHTGLYQPAAARAYLVRALADPRNQASNSSMSHLSLMLAELTLRHGRGAGKLLRFTRPGAKRWAQDSLKGTEDPRARAISASTWRWRRALRLVNRHMVNQGEAARKHRNGEQPRWARIVMAMAGTAVALGGTAMGLAGHDLRFVALVVVAGVAFALAGSVLDRLSRFKLAGVEVDVPPATEMAGTLSIPAAPPLRSVIMPQSAVSQPDVQWQFSEPRRQLLGPAVGLMITGHYSYREASFAWKTK